VTFHISDKMRDGVILLPKAVSAFVCSASEKELRFIIAFAEAMADGVCESDKLAEKIKVEEGEILSLFDFWTKVGVIETNANSFYFNYNGADEKIIPAKVKEIKENKETKKTALKSSLQEMTNEPEREITTIKVKQESKILAVKNISEEEISETVEKEPAFREMLKQIDAVRGGLMSPGDLSTFYWLYDKVGLPAEVILMVVKSAKENKKTNVKYIEEIALSWHQKGIITKESAMANLIREAEMKTAYGGVVKMLGISADKPVQGLKDKIERWMFEWNMDYSMIELAYERTVMNTGKFSLNYMDAILKKWHENGITKKEEAENEKPPAFKAGVVKKQDKPKNEKRNYDIGEWEKKSWEKLQKEAREE